MDCMQELVALGVDLLVFGFCIKDYVSCKRDIQRLKNAPQLPIDGELKSYVERQPDKKVPYAVIRGTVTPIGVPLKSAFSPSVTSVLQVLKLNEHRVMRGLAGMWTDQRKQLHVAFNEMPFELRCNGNGVVVNNAMSASILDLDLVYDNYEPIKLSLMDQVFGAFSGVRQKGLQTTEEVLRVGSFITAVGELELDGDTLQLQAAENAPLFLTTATKSTILQKLQEAKSSTMLKIIICGSISVFIIGIIARKLYKRIKKQQEEQRIKLTLDKERRERRALSRNQQMNNDNSCVVCHSNPKEIIILPCGHVCLCEDCAVHIEEKCPICRAPIRSKAAAFIS